MAIRCGELWVTVPDKGDYGVPYAMVLCGDGNGGAVRWLGDECASCVADGRPDLFRVGDHPESTQMIVKRYIEPTRLRDPRERAGAAAEKQMAH